VQSQISGKINKVLILILINMVKKDLNVREKLNEKLTSREKKLLTEVLREKSINVRERLEKSEMAYKKEVKKSLLTAIIAAFGFLLALSWREALKEYISLVTALSPLKGSLIEAGIVTSIAALGILIVTKLLSE